MKHLLAIATLAAGFVVTIPANATPLAGATKAVAQAQHEAPVTDWQKDILRITAEPEEKKSQKKAPEYIYASSETLNRYDGVFDGPSGRESYYNLPMGLVVQYMRDLGYSYRYWVRKDGVKMYGSYVMVAADLSIRPKGTILQTSLGAAIVCDTGEFIYDNPYALDVAVAW